MKASKIIHKEEQRIRVDFAYDKVDVEKLKILLKEIGTNKYAQMRL